MMIAGDAGREWEIWIVRRALTGHDEEVEDVPAAGEEGPEPVGEEVEGQLHGEDLRSDGEVGARDSVEGLGTAPH